MSLEEVLHKHFDCKNPFLFPQKKIGEDRDGAERYEYFTAEGSKAYDKLVELIYDLETLDVGINANDVIETLDNIVSGTY